MARVTDAQVKELRQRIQKGSSLKKAAMRTDMDRKSARKYREERFPAKAGRHTPGGRGLTHWQRYGRSCKPSWNKLRVCRRTRSWR